MICIDFALYRYTKFYLKFAYILRDLDKIDKIYPVYPCYKNYNFAIPM